MKKLFSFISSMKLALFFLVLIIALSIFATFIPQNRTKDFYIETYAPSLSGLILALNFHRFYRSAMFLVPVGCFFINLLACSLRRIVTRARTGAKKRFGPDILHISLLFLIITGVFSIFLTTASQVILGRGEYFKIPGGYTIRVTKMEQINYSDGRPKGWFTHVSVFSGGDTPIRQHIIEVNKPLRIGPYKVYQHSFSNDGEIIVSDSAGNRGTVIPGEGFYIDSRVIIAHSLETVSGVNGTDDEAGSISALFETRKNGEREFFRLREGDSRFGFTVEEVHLYPRTGLLVRYNPLFPIILGLLFVFIAGLGLTFIQKLGDKKT